MKPIARQPHSLSRVTLQLCALCIAVPASSQTAPASATPAELAKYDTNRNGRLDPNEVSAMRADQAAPAPGALQDQVIELSPFQVSAAQDRGYQASSTLSGTRLNSKLEDLASSITVVTKQQLVDTAAIDINDIFLNEASTEGI